MKRSLAFNLLAFAIILTFALAAHAADNDPLASGPKVTLDLKDTMLAPAIEALFRSRGLNFSISPDAVDIPIPALNISGVPLRQALDSLTRVTGTVYRFENGVVMISAKPNGEKPLDVQLKDMPLADAIDTIFKSSGRSYSIDPGLPQTRVTAVLKNVYFYTALNQVLRAAGASYKVEAGGVYHIVPANPQPANTQNPSAPVGPRTALQTTPVVADEITRIMDLKFISASDIATMLSSKNGGAQISTIGRYKLMLTGTDEQVNAAAETAAALDDESVLPRPIRMKLTAKITLNTAKGPKTYETSTESVGAERDSSLLNLDVSSTYKLPYTSIIKGKTVSQSTMQYYRPALVMATVMPTINSDGEIITLAGKGSFSFTFGTAPGTTVSKDFDIAASTPPGKPVTVAAGSVNLDAGKVDFTVTIVATPDQGRLQRYVAPGGPSPAPATGGGGGGYGGNGGSRYGGSNYGGGYGGYGSPANKRW